MNSDRIPRVLMIAFHYPPVQGSSGIQRTLKFSTYLRDHGWEPLVLTVSPRAYERISSDQVGEIPAGLFLKRSFCLDTARHLSIAGRHLRWMAQPDRWVSWWPPAVSSGLRIIRLQKPDIIFSTYPIATAHLIGHTLSGISGLPWVADFRDSMTEPGYPADPTTWKIHRWLEKKFVGRCAKAVFTTESTRQMYAERYPDFDPQRWAVIENGFDEENFRDAEAGFTPAPLGKPGQLVLIHSGLLYPQERDPRSFFSALRDMRATGEITPENLQVLLQATGNDRLYDDMLAEYGLAEIVKLSPPVPYRAALRQMLCADGLLIFQATMCNHQIPAKIYEYMRAGKPIFTITDPRGSTAATMRKAGAVDIVDISDSRDIARGLRKFLAALRSNSARGVPLNVALANSRRARTAELARLFEEVRPHED